MIPRGLFNRRRSAAPEHQRRLAGAYEVWAGPEFTPADAISLAVLAAREKTLGEKGWGPDRDADAFDYYRAAYRALCTALGLAPDNAMTTVLGLPGGDLETADLPHRHRGGTAQQLSIRAMILNFQDEWGNRMEGDIWGVRALPAAQTTVEAARDWYFTAADALLAGLAPVDLALCAFCGWDPTPSISIERLRAEFAFPEPGQLFSPF